VNGTWVPKYYFKETIQQKTDPGDFPQSVKSGEVSGLGAEKNALLCLPEHARTILPLYPPAAPNVLKVVIRASEASRCDHPDYRSYAAGHVTTIYFLLKT
jgi:hypothetical protein